MIEELEEFFRKFYEEDLLEAVREDEDFVLIDFKELDKYAGHELTEELLENPKDFFDAAEDAIDEIDLGTDKEVSLNVRVENIPDDEKTRIKDLRSKHLGKFVKVEGTVKRASEVKPELEVAIFECPDCGETMEVPQMKKRMSYPSRCDCGRKRGFNQVDRELSDARWIHMEDLFEKVSGEKPGEVSVYLKDGLTTPKMQRRTDPGTRLELTGRVREMPKRIQGKKTKKLDIFLEANWVNPKEVTFEEMEVTEEEEEKIRELANSDNIYEKLVKSLAPSMYGLEEEKESIILQLFGGVPHRLEDGTKIRGDIHILFVGDPSAGKTQMLKLAAEMLPRGKYASGKGTTAAGLCVTGDTLVTLNDGEMREIRDVVEEEFDENGRKKHEEGIFKSSNPSSMEILAFDKDSMKIRPMEVSQFWKIRAPKKLYEVETYSGREVTVTPDNPLPVFDSGEIKWKKAKDVDKEELLAVPRRINTKPEENSSFLPRIIDQTARLQNSSETVQTFAEDLRNNGGIRNFSQKTGISEDGLYHDWRDDDLRGAPRLKDLDRIAEYTGNSLQENLPSILELSQRNGHEIELHKEIDGEMMYLQGLLAGDGDVYSTSYGGIGLRLTNSESEVLQQAESTLRSFNIESSIYREDEKTPQLRFASKIFGSLSQSLGIPIGEKKERIEVSGALSKLPNKLISPFISGLFDADGSAIERDNGASYIDLTQSSKEYLRQIRLLLLRFGIRSKIRKRDPTVSEIRGEEIRSAPKYTLEIKGKENLERFNEKIGFNLSSKDEKLQRIIDSIDEYHTNVDLVPGIGDLLKEAREGLGLSAKEVYGYKNYSYERDRRDISRRKLEEIVEELKSHGSNEAVEKLSRIANSDLYFDGIKEINVVEDGDDWVYDLTVEDGHSFMANGLVVHNTATVVRDEELMGGWVLEAGALVLANKGVLCIDEFDKMSKEDQVNLHEAMSTQSYHPDFELLFPDGSSEKIGDLVDSFMEDNEEEVVEGEDCEMLEISEEDDLNLLSTDFSSIYPRKPSRLSRHGAPDNFYVIKTSSGREVKVTPEHPVWAIKDGEITTSRADEVEEGSWVPVPLNLPIEGEEQELEEVDDFHPNSKEIKVPEHNSPELCSLIGYIVSDCGYELNRGNKNGLNFTNSDPYLLEDFRSLMENLFGLEAYERERNDRGSKRTTLRYVSSRLRDFVNSLGEDLLVKHDEKRIPEKIMKCSKKDIRHLLRRAFAGDGGIVSKDRGLEVVYTTSSEELSRQISDLLLRFSIPSKIRTSEAESGKKIYRVAVTGQNSISKFAKEIGFLKEEENQRLRDYLDGDKSLRKNLFETVPEVGGLFTSVLEDLNMSREEAVGWSLEEYENNNLNFTRPTLKRVLSKLEERYIELLNTVNSLPLKGEELRKVRREFGVGVDVIAEELGVSNSTVYYREDNSTELEEYREVLEQILKERLQVKTKIEFLGHIVDSEVGWVQVEAVEKVPSDVDMVYDVTVPGRTFISNGMVLHNTVSISKATIQATLPAETSIIGGANPKFSRFDPYRPIAEQIDIPDTLLSRFDLKFALRDVPDRDRDEKIVDHIIDSRVGDESQAEPLIDIDFLKKYISYARRNCRPQMTKKAAATLKNFYVDMRNKYVDAESDTVPITLRQYEALQRLAEASAKVRLDEEVKKEDAQRAIKLMKHSIKQLGMDPETHEIDIDRAEGGTPASERSKMSKVMEVLDNLEEDLGKNIPEEDLLSALEEEGLSKPDKLIKEMKNKGMIFEPRPGHVQKV